MKIAYVCWHYREAAGIPNHIRTLTQDLRGRVDVVVYATDVKNDQSQGSIRFYKVPRYKNFIKKVWHYYQCLKKTYLKERFDIVHCHDSEAFFACYLLRRMYSKPIIFTLHASIFEKGRSQDYPVLMGCKYRFTESFSVKNADKVVAISQKMRDIYRKSEAGKSRTVIIPGTISKNRLSQSQARSYPDVSKEKICLFVGGLRPVKGIEYLIQAIALVRQRFDPIRLHIVGEEGSIKMKGKLKQLVNDLTLNDSVDFKGFKKEEQLELCYQQADIFCLPSLSEPQGLVVLEAMSYGLPVVASCTGGIPDMIEDRISGVLVEPRNPQAIADAIVELLTKPELYESISREVVNRCFFFKNVNERIFLLYEELCDSEYHI